MLYYMCDVCGSGHKYNNTRTQADPLGQRPLGVHHSELGEDIQDVCGDCIKVLNAEMAELGIAHRAERVYLIEETIKNLKGEST